MGEGILADAPVLTELLRRGNIAGSVEALTESEAQYILRFRPEEFRRRIETIEKDLHKDTVSKSGKFSIGGLYTGSAADYEKPSLMKVGTGEGSQVYGWGLYASNRRGVAEGYADLGAQSYGNRIMLNGKEVRGNIPQMALDALGAITPGKNVKEQVIVAAEILDGNAAMSRDKVHNKFPSEENAKKYDEAAKWIRDHADKIEILEGSKVIYEQTFFTNRAPGDESHLLNWYEPVSEENAKRAIDAVKSLGLDRRDLDATFGNGWENKLREATGQKVYQMVTDAFANLDVDNAEKSASELLAKFDIDGIKYPVNSYGGKTVKDGDKAGWNYVSFRDDNINVDHKWVDGQAKFSVGKESRRQRKLGLTNASSGGVPDSRSAEALNPFGRHNGGTANIIPQDGRAVQGKIQKFNNHDLKIDTQPDRPTGAIMKDLARALGLKHKGRFNSSYAVYETPEGKVAFRLSGHKAEGDNFGRNGTKRNTSVVIEMYDWQHGESNVPFEEFVYPRDVFDENRNKIVAAIMNGVGKMLETGRFVDSSGLAQYTENKGENFRRWFGKSKTVDADGKPLLMYRGAAFDPLKQPNGEGVIKPEAYFTTDPNYAKRYAGSEGKVRAYYLKIEHPFDIRDPECQKDFAKIYPGVKLARGKSGALDWAEASTVDAEFLNENFPGKYDGIIYDEASDWAMEGNLPKWRGLSYVPLNGGAQVKSATDNIGTFDPSNPDVRFSAGNRGGNAAEPDLAFDPAMIVYNPKLKAMGETEQNRGGIAAGIEKKEALRPWTRKGSPCDLAKPIAMDCADMVQLFRAVSGSTRNPIIRKGEHIPGRPNAIGLNRGGSVVIRSNPRPFYNGGAASERESPPIRGIPAKQVVIR